MNEGRDGDGYGGRIENLHRVRTRTEGRHIDRQRFHMRFLRIRDREDGSGRRPISAFRYADAEAMVSHSRLKKECMRQDLGGSGVFGMRRFGGRAGT